MLELRGITKRFGAFTALEAVDCAVREGEIVGLLGENGAGKSTLLNIIGGVLSPTAGQILWDDTPVRFAFPREATQRGIGVVHQHFMLVPAFTVAENIALHALQSGFTFDAADWARRVQQWARSLGWRVNGMQRVSELSVGERQRVEILKALFANSGEQNLPTARLLLLDEPTANLTPAEVEELFAMLRRLREQKRGVVFVSHKLQEVLALCDRIVVLRHGRVGGERRTHETTAQELATLMVGRELRAEVSAPRAIPLDAPARLVIENLTCGTLRDFSLTVRRGEIVGLAGVDGNGQRELVEVLSGLRQPEGGGVRIAANGHQVHSQLALIPPDRQLVGLILSFDLAENMALHPSLRAECRQAFVFDWGHARQRTRDLMQRFDVRAPATAERTRAANLSGGNQQKLVIARALCFHPAVVVAADPTRGLDIGAAQFVHEQLRQTAQDGTPGLLISTDLDEVLQLSDRIGVLYEGRLLPGPDLLPRGTSREWIGALMGGSLEGKR